MKKRWLSPENCTGCGLCENVCPVGAISMLEDGCGFIYPSFDSKCIDCNLCEEKCKKRTKKIDKISETPLVYAAWSKNDNTRFTSTSGGLFSELARYIISNNGYVSGAVYSEKHSVIHTVVDNYDDLEKLRQSKYVQSNSKKVYKKIYELIKSGEVVMFCGTPCQIAALYAMFNNERIDNLYTVEFICRGVNSPKALRSWISEIEIKNKVEVERVWFKYKEGGWKSSPQRTRLDLKDGQSIVLENEKNAFMHGYLLSNLYIRSSCGNCEFKGVDRKADITLADFWGIDSSLDDDKGTSMVLLNNKHGEYLFELIKNQIYYYKRDFDEVLKENGCFSNSVVIPKKGTEFLEEIEDDNFSTVLKKYMKKPFIKRAIIKMSFLQKEFLKRFM